MKTLLLVGCVVLSQTLSAQQFSSTFSVNLPDSAETATAEWVDLDNDGLLDVFAFATLSSGEHFFVTYKGDTVNGLTHPNAQTTGFKDAVYRLADVDGDNDIDVLVSGNSGESSRTSFFENQSDFTFVEHALLEKGGSVVRFADVNGDGQTDLLLSGNDQTGSFFNIYRFGNTWNLVHDSLKIAATAIEIFDFDNDGDNDIFVSGMENGVNVARALTNEGALYFKALSLAKMANGKTSVGDLNHDGYLDIFLTGVNASNQQVSLQFLNTGDLFIAKDTLTPLANSKTFLADFNSDGQCDLQLLGNSISGDTLNSILLAHSAPVILNKTKLIDQTFGDYDRDGDLDILQVLEGMNSLRLQFSRNDFAPKNEGPKMAKGAFGFVIFNKLFLYWGRGMDDHTPDNAITYDVTMHVENSELLVGEFDLLSNKRLTVTRGNAGSRNYFILKPVVVSPFRYSVQAIDNALETRGVVIPPSVPGVCSGTGEQCESVEIVHIAACKNEALTFNAEFGAQWFSLSKGYLAEGSSYQMNATATDTIFSFAADHVTVGCPSLRIFLIDLKKNFIRKSIETKFVCEGQIIPLEEEADWANIMWKSLLRGNLGTAPSINYAVSQNDTLTLLASNEFGCGIERKTALRISKPAVSLSGEIYQILRGESVQISASGGETYRWTPEESLDNSLIATPTASPLSSTQYTVTVTDSIGCASSANVQVIVEGTAFIPNLFTPNDDGKNDEVKVYGLSTVSNFSFVIHNREGSVLYETQDPALAAGSGWDGTAKGVKQPAGVYYWKVRGEHSSGRKLLLNGKTTGSIVLIR